MDWLPDWERHGHFIIWTISVSEKENSEDYSKERGRSRGGGTMGSVIAGKLKLGHSKYENMLQAEISSAEFQFTRVTTIWSNSTSFQNKYKTSTTSCDWDTEFGFVWETVNIRIIVLQCSKNFKHLSGSKIDAGRIQQHTSVCKCYCCKWL